MSQALKYNKNSHRLFILLSAVYKACKECAIDRKRCSHCSGKEEKEKSQRGTESERRKREMQVDDLLGLHALQAWPLCKIRDELSMNFVH